MDISYEEISKQDAPLRKVAPSSSTGSLGPLGSSGRFAPIVHRPVVTTEKFIRKRAPEKFINTLSKNYVPFWLDDPFALLTEVYIIPSSNMTLNQKLNSIVRLSIIGAIAGYALMNASRKIFYAVILAMIITIYIYYSMNAASIIHHPEKINHEKKIAQIVTLLGPDQVIDNTKIAEIAEQVQVSPAEIKSHLEPVAPQQTPLKTEEIVVNNEPIDNNEDLFKIPPIINEKQIIYPGDAYDNNLFLGTTQNMQREYDNRREVLLSYSDRLNGEFEQTLTKDFYQDAGRKWRDEGSFLVDRDIYHPKNTDLYFDRY